ncbi:hypothetical protein DICVIV_02422 [Dictyocaulus viviparus]|uniref:Uncharacterized protein n=1 Tax=Dictyocaulus viviparus TaxID=29172 RepID=A0A0D8Y3G7_DICVI|nr:hypothetical protein DICVIV_02422 [Dictyocaulus viviparus]
MIKKIENHFYQLRYAAMDAYCLLLIYDVCCLWSQRIGVSIEEILSQQEPIHPLIVLKFSYI